MKLMFNHLCLYLFNVFFVKNASIERFFEYMLGRWSLPPTYIFLVNYYNAFIATVSRNGKIISSP